MAENLRLSSLLVVDSLTVDIVAVYGISGHSFRPWAADEASTCWLLDFLSNDIPEANLITFGHKLPVDDLTTWSISDQAEFLLQELAKTREEGPKVSVEAFDLSCVLVRVPIIPFILVCLDLER